MWGDIFFKVRRSVTNSGVNPSLCPPGTLPRWQSEFVVAGDYCRTSVRVFDTRRLRKTAIISCCESKGEEKEKEEKKGRKRREEREEKKREREERREEREEKERERWRERICR